jgi:hypothetical protein
MAINIKPSHKGLLHKNLGVSQGEHIPKSKLAIKDSDSEAVRKRKQFAINASKWKHAGGGTIDDEAFAYDRWKRSLPDNLQNNDPAYNLRGYWEGLNKPEKFQPFEEQMQDDGYYHASTRNPETGEYYKGKPHPTTQHAIDADREMGYYTEMKNNKIYTNTYTKGGRVLPKFVKAGTIGNNPTLPQANFNIQNSRQVTPSSFIPNTMVPESSGYNRNVMPINTNVVGIGRNAPMANTLNNSTTSEIMQTGANRGKVNIDPETGTPVGGLNTLITPGNIMLARGAGKLAYGVGKDIAKSVASAAGSVKHHGKHFVAEETPYHLIDELEHAYKAVPAHAYGGMVGSRSLRKFAEAGTVDTGAGITDYAGYAQMAMPIAHMLMPDQQVKDKRGNAVGSKMDSSYAALSKGADWASKAAVAGPVASIAAGVIGAGVGYFDNEDNNRKIDNQERLANDDIYNQDTSKAFNTNTGNFTQRRSTNTNMSFAAGGQVIDEDMGNPNAELELNETFRDPMTGETGMVDGPSHDNGGIEMSLAEGTQIWSDRLKHNGKTFASLTKPIINKIANIEKGLDTNPNSRFKQNSIKLLNSQLDFFFNIQESDKQQDEMKRTLKKQEGGVVDDMGNYHYANGGIYIKPENRNKMAMGGMMKYDEGGPVIGSINPSTGRAYTMQDIFAYNQGEDLRPHVPGQLSGDTYTGGNINLGQTTRNFALNNSSGEYGPLNNQSFTQSINKKSANIPETIQGRQLPNYSLQSPTLNAYTTPETVVPNATYARKPNGINYNNPEYVDPNFQMLGTTGRTNLPTTGAGPGGVNPALFNKANYSSGDYYMNHPTPKGGSSADVTAAYEKQRSNDAADQANMTAEEKSAALRNRIDAFRKRGKIGQGVTAAVSNLTQADRLRSLAAPNKISNVNYLSSLTGPDLVNYGNQRNAIEQGASAVVDKAGKYLGNSGSIMATANAANLQKQQQLGESYQGQENANAAIMNQALAQKNQLAVAQAERNSAIEQENFANKYGYDAMLASGLNANDAITASQMGQMFGNDVTFGNELERARILGNKYAGKVRNSTDDNTIAANNSQLVESRFGGTIGKYADGGNVYNTRLNAVLNEQSNKNAALMDLEYQQNLNAGNKAFTSKVTGLDYKVLPRSEKDLYAANMWKETHKTAPTKSQIGATKKAIENKPTSSVKAKEVARSIETWNTQGMTSNNVPKAQVPTATPDFGNQSTMQYMDQNNMPTFNNPNAEPTRNEIARMMKNVPTYKPGTYKQQATPLFESVPTDKRSKYTPSTAANPDYGNQNTMQYMNQNNMPTNFGPPKLVNNPNTKTIKMNEGLNQNNVDNTRTNLQVNKSPKKQDQNIPMLNQKIGKPTIMNQGSDAYNDIRDYAKANETGTTSTKKENTRSINTSKTNILTDAKSAINKYDINSMKRDQSAMVSKAAESALHNIANGFKKPVPTSLRVEIKDILNNQLGTNFKVTEDDFTDSQKAKILELVNKKDSMNKVNPRKYIKAINTYKDYDLIDNENMNDINSLWGDAKNVRNTLGEFNYKQKGDTTYIDDIWNLNEKENGKVKKSPIEWYNYWTNKGYEIGPAIPRAAGSAWGSAGSAKGDDSKGTKMNIKLYNPKNKSKNKS